MFFQFHVQTSLPGGSSVCQVPAQCKFLWLNSKPLTIGGYNEMLTDPLAPTNAMARCKGGYVPGELQLGLGKPINPYKKKSGFSLTPRVHRDFWGQTYLPLLWPLSTEKEMSREILSCKWMWSAFLKWRTLVSPVIVYSTSLRHFWDHFFQSRIALEQFRSLGQNLYHTEIQPVFRDSYFIYIVVAYTLGLNIFIFSKTNIKTFSVVEH